MHQRCKAPSNYRRWIIAGLSFLALALAYSSRAAFSLIMPLWEQELGWSRSFTSGTAASALLVMAFLAPFGGRLVDKRGARSVDCNRIGGTCIGLPASGADQSAMGIFSGLCRCLRRRVRVGGNPCGLCCR